MLSSYPLDAATGAAAILHDPASPLRTSFEISPAGVAVTRRVDGTLLYVNRVLAERLGYAPAELVGRTGVHLRFDGDLDDRARMLDEVERRWISRHEVSLRHRDGHTVWMRVNASVIELGGEPCMLAYCEDVSELRRLEAARHAREVELATMYELAPVGISVVDVAERCLVRVNAAMCALLGRSADALLGRAVLDVTHPDDRPGNERLFEAIARGEVRHGCLEKRYLQAYGGVRWAQVHFRVVDDALTHRRLLLSIVLDTTRAREDEAERRLLTSALEATANGVAITDTTGALRWINRAFTELTGYRADEVLGRNPRVLKSGAQDEAYYRDMWRTITAGEVWRGELINRRKDGGTYHEEMTITPVRDDAGAISHYVAIKQDITARKHIEQARISGEERYRLALEATELGTWQFDFATATFTLGPRAQLHFGLPPTASLERMIGCAHPDDRALVHGSFERAAAPDADGRVVIEYRVVHADGGVRWLSVHAQHRFAGEGADRRAIATIGTSRDVTDSKHAADALRLSEDRYRSLVDNLDDLVFSVDTTGAITFVSPAIARFGYRPEEVIGRSMAEFVHPDDRAAVLAGLTERTRGTGAATAPREHRWVDASGKIHHMRASARPLVVDGALVGITGLATDVTLQRDTEAQLRQAQRMEAIGRLAGGVAHDFNNLLGVITAYTEIVMTELHADDPLQADLKEIAEATRRAAALTRQLLAFSRRQVLQPEPVDLGDLVAGMSKLLHRLIGEDISLRVDTDDELGLTRVDPGQLEQVVMNLAVNARDAMPDGGTLTIACHDVQLDDAAGARLELAPGAYVALTMTDTGCGMTADVRGRIFEPFFTTKPVGRGTGLGLATVHGIVKQSGGGIAVDTAPGRGTTFRIYLPRLGEQVQDPAHRPSPPGRAVQGHERILVVEDEPGLRSVTRRLLSAAGYRVDLAANAGEALLICEQHGRAIDLVLTDVVMPGMSGPRLVERLAGLCPRAKVMFMSGYTDDMLAQHDIVEHTLIRKPFDRGTLTAKVRSVLDGGARAMSA